MSSRLPLRLTLPVALLALIGLFAKGGDDGAGPPRRDGVVAAEPFGKLPLRFVENGGQAAAGVSHVVLGKATTVLFGPEGMALRLWRPAAKAACGAQRVDGVCVAALGAAMPPDPLAEMAPGSHLGAADRGTVDALELAFVGARPGLRAEGRRPDAARVSYFHGPPSQWRRGLRTYGELVYRDVWPGIDLVYEGGLDELKHSFIVHPGTDPGLIRLAWRGAEGLAIDAEGAMVVDTPAGALVDAAPVAFQDTDGRRTPVAARYALGPEGAAGERPYGFALGAYDPGRELVIDPAMVVYASILGTEGDDRGLGIELDDARNTYLTGEMGPDAFVAKISPDGTQLLYLAIIGGDATDAGFDIDVDPHGSAYFTGSTASTEASFPVKGGPDLTFGGGALDGIVVKLSPDGADIEYAGYIGGAGIDFGEALAVDEDGNAYASGVVESTEATFPVVVGPDLTQNGLVDAYVVKVKADPTAPDPLENFDWSGFVGGAGNDVAAVGEWWSAGHLAIDRDRNVYISNETTSDERSFPDGDGFGSLPGPDRTFNGDTDAYVAKIRADGTSLAYAGYIGGTGYDHGKGMAVDDKGAAYLTGMTFSDEASFPVKVGPDLTYNGKADGFVAKVLPDGTGLAYCGYFGGDDDDSGQAVALGPRPEQALYVTGWTESTEGTFPVILGPDLTHNGPYGLPDEENELDSYVGRLAADPSHADPRRNWDYLGYIGGSQLDLAFWLDVDDHGDAYVAGDTWSDLDSFPDGQGIRGRPGLGEGAHGDRDATIVKVSYLPLAQSREVFLPVLGRGAQKADLLAGARPAPSHTAEPIATRTVTPTATPTRLPAAPVELPPGEELLFYDDFADPHSGWQEVDEDTASVRYRDGWLELSTSEARGESQAASPVQNWGDGALELTLERLTDSNGFFGILFGPSMGTGFIFVVYGTGQYGLFQRVGAHSRVLIPATRAAQILPDMAVNRLRLERYGELLVILANGKVVGRISDPDLDERGGIQVINVASSDGGLATRIDDLLVTRWMAGHPAPTLPPTPSRTPTRTPRPTGPTPTQAAGAVLFQDDFSDPGSGWRVDDGAQNSKRYVDGEYEISIHEAELFVAPFAPGLTCADCTVEAAAKFGGGVAGAAGLVLTERSQNDAVFFEILSDGRYLVERYSGGAWEVLIAATASSAIKRGAGQVNQLKAVRLAGHLSLFVNGTALKSVDVPGLVEAGRAGVVAVCGPTPGFVVRYDDFVVRAGAALGPQAAPPRESREGGGALEATGELAGRALDHP